MRALPSPATTDSQAITRPEGDNAARFANNLLPVDWQPAVKTSPVFNYPYARSRESLDVLSRNESPRSVPRPQTALCQSGQRRFCDADDRRLYPTAAQGFCDPALSRDRRHGISSRSRGRGRVAVGDQVFDWQPHDIFVVPSWVSVSHQAAGEAVLFSYSDRPVQEKLGLWREQRGNA